jgi:hypothetical protein
MHKVGLCPNFRFTWKLNWHLHMESWARNVTFCNFNYWEKQFNQMCWSGIYSLPSLLIYILQILRTISMPLNSTSLICEQPIQATLKLMISNRERKNASFSVLVMITKLKCITIQNNF